MKEHIQKEDYVSPEIDTCEVSPNCGLCASGSIEDLYIYEEAYNF